MRICTCRYVCTIRVYSVLEKKGLKHFFHHEYGIIRVWMLLYHTPKSIIICFEKKKTLHTSRRIVASKTVSSVILILFSKPCTSRFKKKLKNYIQPSLDNVTPDRYHKANIFHETYVYEVNFDMKRFAKTCSKSKHELERSIYNALKLNTLSRLNEDFRNILMVLATQSETSKSSPTPRVSSNALKRS